MFFLSASPGSPSSRRCWRHSWSQNYCRNINEAYRTIFFEIHTFTKNIQSPIHVLSKRFLYSVQTRNLCFERYRGKTCSGIKPWKKCRGYGNFKSVNIKTNAPPCGNLTWSLCKRPPLRPLLLLSSPLCRASSGGERRSRPRQGTESRGSPEKNFNFEGTASIFPYIHLYIHRVYGNWEKYLRA